jgi:Ca2+-binding RTX toxin-like protein
MSTAFRISLDGAQQVPVLMSSKSGLGTAIFDSATSSMSFTVNVQGLDWGPLLGQPSQTPDTADDINGVHIHNAARGVNGAIVLDWPGGGDADDFAVSGVLADGSRTLTSNWETTDVNPITPSVATLAGATLGADVPLYMNIHTVAFAGGEIRGQLVTIATDNDEFINGTAGNDILPGLGGHDTITGGAGDDTLDGGTNSDTLFGGLGNDTYVVDHIGDVVAENTGEGIDTINTTIDLVLSPNVENLVLLGSGDLQGYGNSLVNTLTGNAGNNLLNGFGGADTMIGGAGNDTYFVDDAGDTVMENSGQGSDVVFATVDQTLSANVETLILQGSADLQGYGNTLDNTIYGNTGNNLLNGNAGADIMVGEAGNDTYFVDNANDAVVENAMEGTDAVFASAHYALSPNVETLVLEGSADLQGYGNSLDNALFGNSGGNLLNGSTGADTMYGGAGSDVYFVDNPNDTVVENSGEGSDAVFATAHYGLSANVETLVLQSSADLQGYGNSLANVIYGNAGNNLLDGRAGADLMVGGTGNDTYFVDDSNDAVFENPGEGTDAVFAIADYGLSAGVEILIQQGAADLQGYGNVGNNTIYGNAGNNLLDGSAGADTIYGGAGNDTYFIDAPGDVVVENLNEGADAIFSTANIQTMLAANVEALVLLGAGNLFGIGNALANNIYGNSGDNSLDGGGGADVLVGNAGNDTFQFHAGEADGDTVFDFAGNGGVAGDLLLFLGFGAPSGGATSTQIGATNQWQIHSGLDAHNEIITFSNGASVDPSDYTFI